MLLLLFQWACTFWLQCLLILGLVVCVDYRYIKHVFDYLVARTSVCTCNCTDTCPYFVRYLTQSIIWSTHATYHRSWPIRRHRRVAHNGRAHIWPHALRAAQGPLDKALPRLTAPPPPKRLPHRRLNVAQKLARHDKTKRV